jgi:hypothetical protein
MVRAKHQLKLVDNPAQVRGRILAEVLPCHQQVGTTAQRVWVCRPESAG